MPSHLQSGASVPDTLSVSELTAQIKQLLEQGFPRLRISGEISRLTARAGGHIYFTIKDANASLGAVIWKSTALRLGTKPEEGRQYIFHGHISLYPPQGRYQLVVSRIEEEGGGKLAAEFERRKRLFAEYGWFDPAGKHELPALPRHIGVVTSETTAALQDVRKVLATRPGWLHLTLAPTTVQGASAPQGIAKALKRLQSMPERPDVILLVRGGGSPEDLWCFNDELVVRTIMACDIPIITGIGHEIDLSLADLAADLHAATPSNAAELVCPASETLRRQMPRMTLLRQLVLHHFAQAQKSTQQAENGLRHRWRLWRDEKRMHLERRQHLLDQYAAQALKQRRHQLRLLEKQLHPLEPGHQLRLRQRRLDAAMQRLARAASQQNELCNRHFDHARQSLHALHSRFISIKRSTLMAQGKQLAALGPQGVLARGYSMNTAPDGRVIRSALGLKQHDAMRVSFHDGSVLTEITKVEKI